MTRVLLVDNHDSYTYNLFHLLASLVGAAPTVVTHDDPAWERLEPAGFDAVVISPGPGRPQRAADVGNGAAVLDHTDLPVLGVCLGHQLIAHLAGAEVALAPRPQHGHLTRVRHIGTGLFTDVPQGFTAVRYHSLAVAEPLPACLEATAWAEDGVLMGLEHRDLPRWGVQFHPESIAGEHGRTLVENFLTRARPAARAATPPIPDGGATGRADRRRAVLRPTAMPHSARVGEDLLLWWTLDGAVDTEAAFTRLYGRDSHAFWLDSGHLDDTARFSFLGGPDGPRGEVLTYRVGDNAVTVRDTTGAARAEPGTIFDALRRRTATQPGPSPDGLPFDFAGGYVGYFGYELKADCGATAAHTASTPDAVWLRVDRFVAVDHVEGRTYLVARERAAHTEPPAESPARRWLSETAAALAGLTGRTVEDPPGPVVPPEEWLTRPREDYLAGVKECLGYLAAGESYEICLTTQLRAPAPGDDMAFYRRLRRASPAPYGALLRLGELAVHSASPERFLRISPDATLDSRPIKGTAPRNTDPEVDARLCAELRTSPKTRAENLMIVDLLRNDVGRVCEVGSVTVPEFMYTRSYATVHQLISTVRGRLRPDVAPVDAARACFPGGSMTGAPKERTMELLDRLEDRARGVYSGALGYVSYDGVADLSIVIRTAVRWRDELHVGAGGAIVLDSIAEEEYEEMLVKAAVPLRGLG